MVRWWRASAAAARGQGECPGKAGGALQQAAASGRAASDPPDGVGEGGRRGLRIAVTHLSGEEGRRVRKWSSWEGACCAGAGAG